MDEYEILSKIAEMRSYIASDWPSVKEMKDMYIAIARLEALLEEGDEGKEDRPHI